MSGDSQMQKKASQDGGAAIAANDGAENLESDAVQILSFTVDGAEYGVDIMCVREIKGWSETTRIPNSPDAMRGVINLRGIVIPIFDMRIRFGREATETTDKHVVVIIQVGKRTVGLLVDKVSDILTVCDSEIKNAPGNGESEIDDAYVRGLISLDDKMVVLLDIEYLFDRKVLEKASDKAEEQVVESE